MSKQNPIRIGDTANRLAACFGVDKPLPFPIPVWVADVNCEVEAFADELVQLRTADGDGVDAPSYADLKSGKKVPSLNVFLRGQGYRSPDKMKFSDAHGEFHQPGQLTY